jgi:hypothetical protein
VLMKKSWIGKVPFRRLFSVLACFVELEEKIRPRSSDEHSLFMDYIRLMIDSSEQCLIDSLGLSRAPRKLSCFRSRTMLFVSPSIL